MQIIYKVKLNALILQNQFHYHEQQLKVKNSGGPLDNQTWQTE